MLETTGGDINGEAAEQPDTGMLLEEMYRKYNPIMKHRAMRFARSMVDAEDIVGSCWVKLVAQGDKLAVLSDKMRTAYVMKAVRNTSLDYLKKRSREESLIVLETLADHANLEADVEQKDTIRGLLSRLTPRQRQVVRMHLAGCTAQEIAQALQVSESCVRVHWHRALDRMRPALMRWKRGQNARAFHNRK